MHPHSYVEPVRDMPNCCCTVLYGKQRQRDAGRRSRRHGDRGTRKPSCSSSSSSSSGSSGSSGSSSSSSSSSSSGSGSFAAARRQHVHMCGVPVRLITPPRVELFRCATGILWKEGGASHPSSFSTSPRHATPSFIVPAGRYATT
ncbi:hypothetical protein LY76DRAFT_162757 [Colletotrichum caudatum]|nr:hypothetical protein LY76DRAFT_162757 [Colletotrichum caudatum]